MALMTKHGSTIIKVRAVGHETYKKVADWFFVGTVRYEGGDDRERQIRPYEMCYETDDDKAELARLMKRMNEYLDSAGAWHDSKETRDGRMYSWTPSQPKGEAPIEV